MLKKTLWNLVVSLLFTVLIGISSVYADNGNNGNNNNGNNNNGNNGNSKSVPISTPEPATLLLFGTGLAVMAVVKKVRRSKTV